MSEINMNPAAAASADSFDPDQFEEQETAVELHRGGGAVAKLGQAAFTLKLPKRYLQVAHGVGGLSQEGYTPGELVIAKAVSVYTPPKQAKGKEIQAKAEPAIVSVLEAIEFWKEETVFGGGTLPRTWDSEVEAQAAGMTTVYPKWGSGLPMPTARPAINLKLLVREPEGVCDRGYFMLELAGKFWAPCNMIVDKGSYKEVAESLSTAVYVHGEGKLHVANFALTTRNKFVKSTGNYTWVPVFQMLGAKSPAEIEELSNKMNLK